MLRDLLLVEKDERLVENGFHALRIRDEVRGEVAAVELHAFDDVELGLEALAFFDRDHAFLSDLAHRFSEDLADRLVRVRGDRADLSNFVGVAGGLGDSAELSRRWPSRPCRCRA